MPISPAALVGPPERAGNSQRRHHWLLPAGRVTGAGVLLQCEGPVGCLAQSAAACQVGYLASHGIDSAPTATVRLHEIQPGDLEQLT